MRVYINKTPIKIGSIAYYNGVKYKIIKVESTKDDASIVFKSKTVE